VDFTQIPVPFPMGEMLKMDTGRAEGNQACFEALSSIVIGMFPREICFHSSHSSVRNVDYEICSGAETTRRILVDCGLQTVPSCVAAHAGQDLGTTTPLVDEAGWCVCVFLPADLYRQNTGNDASIKEKHDCHTRVSLS
jgi:hypothetical protein